MTRNDAERLISRAREGDVRSLSRLITMVEDGGDGRIYDLLSGGGGRSHVVGFTGPPGAGKSSLISCTASTLVSMGERVGIIAIDPSSPISGGAFLGDRVRMNDLALDENVFIRSMGSRGAPGGVSEHVGEVAMLMDATGFTTVLVETVGAGQSDIEVMNCVHTVVVMFAPGSGDDIQMAKAGLMDVGDIFVVNKSDMPEAGPLLGYLKNELDGRGSTLPVLAVSARDRKGTDDLVHLLLARRRELEAAGRLAGLREKVLLRRLRSEILRRVEKKVDAWMEDEGRHLLSSGLSPARCADEWERRQ